MAVELPGADIPLEDDLAEALELTRAAGGQVVDTVTCRRSQVDPALFIGSGKAAELADLVVAKLGPVQDELRRLMDDPAHVDSLIADGARRARAIAEPILADVHDIVGFLRPKA